MFCIHPKEKLENVAIIGGTKKLNYDRIREINPDLIIAEREENLKEMVEVLEEEFPVYVTEVKDLESALRMISDLGEICDREQGAKGLVDEIQVQFGQLVQAKPDLSCLYLIWRKPWMAAGSSTFIDSMLRHCGLKNVLGTERYPVLTESELQDLAPDLIFLSSEPFPFKDKHIAELKAILPGSKVVLVDGEMFSWYGSRMRLAPAYFNQLLTSLE